MDLIINNHLIDTPILDIVKQIKSELHGTKLAKITKKGSDVIVTCPNINHKGGNESRESCRVYCGDNPDIEYGTCHCFTCGLSGPLYHFVATCFDEDDEFGKDWLVERFGNTLVEKQLQLTSINLDTQREQFMDESILDSFQSYHPYMDIRKLSKKICETFQVKYDTHTQCLVFPVRDERGRLKFLTRRSVNSKKFIIDEGVEKPLYLLYFIKQHNIQEVTLVESQINALYLWSLGIPSICSFGCNITSKQLDLLNKSGITHLYIAYDGDDAGRHGTMKVLNGISSNIVVDIMQLPEGKDVNDLSEEQINQLPIINSLDWLYNKRGNKR